MIYLIVVKGEVQNCTFTGIDFVSAMSGISLVPNKVKSNFEMNAELLFWLSPFHA